MIELITSKNPKSPISEAYRTVRTNLQFSNIDCNLKVIGITSSGPAEGKTTTASNLAETFAQTGKKVLIIDADLRKPRVHKVFNVSNQRGLTNVLVDFSLLDDVLQHGGTNVHILTSGPIPPNPSELLASKTFDQLLLKLQEQYDVIIVDTPPVGLVTDAAILSTKLNGMILVTASGKANIDNVKHAKELLEQVNANILGCIMTMMPVNKKDYYGYHYYGEESINRKKR